MVFVHGLWLLPSSPDRWAARFRDRFDGLVQSATVMGSRVLRPCEFVDHCGGVLLGGGLALSVVVDEHLTGAGDPE